MVLVAEKLQCLAFSRRTNSRNQVARKFNAFVCSIVWFSSRVERISVPEWTDLKCTSLLALTHFSQKFSCEFNHPVHINFPESP